MAYGDIVQQRIDVKAEREAQEMQKQERQKKAEEKSAVKRDVMKGRMIDFAPVENPEEEEKQKGQILAEGAAAYQAGKVNPAYVGVISEAERMKRYGDLFASLNYFKEQYLNLINGLSPDLATAKEHARDYIPEPQVSRGALDELERRGAVQMEMPEAPSMWNPAIQMLVGAIGQAFQNVNQSELAAAEAEQTSSVAAANAAAYQAAEFASFKQNRQRVLEINTQLQAKYQDDLISAMRDYEARADAAAWNYEQQLLDAAFNEQRQYFQLLGKVEEYDTTVNKIKADIGMEYLKDKQRAGEINVQIYNRSEEFNAKLRADIEQQTLRRIAEQQALKEKLRKDGLLLYGEKIVKGSGMASAYYAGGASLSLGAQRAVMDLDFSMWSDEGKENNRNMQMLTAGMNELKNRVLAKINASDMTDAQKKQAYGNFLSSIDQLSQRNVGIAFYEVSDSMLDRLMQGNIQFSLLTQTGNYAGLDPNALIMKENMPAETHGWIERYTKAIPLALVNTLYDDYTSSMQKQPRLLSGEPFEYKEKGQE